MGMFERETCSICGGKCCLLNKDILADGYVCAACGKDISLNISSTRKITVAQIKQYLVYRAENRAKLQNVFTPTFQVGSTLAVFIDTKNKLWCVSRSGDYLQENADLFTFAEFVSAYREDEMTQQEAPDASMYEVHVDAPQTYVEIMHLCKEESTSLQAFTELENAFDILRENSFIKG